MGAIRYQIQQELWARDPVLAESVGIKVVSANNDAYAYVEAIAKHNWQKNMGYFGERSPILLIGYSDGATCVRQFAFRLRKEYGTGMETIDYVGMIDLVREDIEGWPLSGDDQINMPPAYDAEHPYIMWGDNFYERTWAEYPLYVLPLWYVNGHEVAAHPTIHNFNMTVLEDGGHPDHVGILDFKRIPEVRDTIAYYAAWSYVRSFSLLNKLYGA